MMKIYLIFIWMQIRKLPHNLPKQSVSWTSAYFMLPYSEAEKENSVLVGEDQKANPTSFKRLQTLHLLLCRIEPAFIWFTLGVK